MFPMPAPHRRSHRRSSRALTILFCPLAWAVAASGHCVAQDASVATPHAPASPRAVPPIPLKPAAVPDPTQQEQRPVQRPEKAAPKPTPKLGPGVNDAGQAANMLRTTKLSLISLIDRRVIGREKREIGHVIDVLVDAKGQPAALVVDVGGFMGMGNRRIAIAWERFALAGRKAADALQLPLTDAQVKAAPAYDGSDGVTVVRDALEPAAGRSPASGQVASGSSRVDLGLGPAEPGDAGSASDPLNPD